MSKPKFKFKKHKKQTGLAAVGFPWTGSDIYLNGVEVGEISAPNYAREGWRAQLMVEGCGDNPNRNWHWITFRQVFSEEAELKKWLLTEQDKITAKYALVTK